jgi:hypothetical protein
MALTMTAAAPRGVGGPCRLALSRSFFLLDAFRQLEPKREVRHEAA